MPGTLSVCRPEASASEKLDAMACRPTAGTAYYVLTFTLTPRPATETETPGPMGIAAICLDARYAARSYRDVVNPIHASTDIWRQVALEIASGLPSSTLSPESATRRMLASGETVDARWLGTWRLEASDVAGLSDEILRRLTAMDGDAG